MIYGIYQSTCIADAFGVYARQVCATSTVTQPVWGDICRSAAVNLSSDAVGSHVCLDSHGVAGHCDDALTALASHDGLLIMLANILTQVPISWCKLSAEDKAQKEDKQGERSR